MKKFGLIIVATAMIFAFCSCEKENLGTFNPKKKLSKVYTESNGHYLREQWLWNENQLQRVEYYKKNGNVDYTCHYQYKNGLLSRIETDDQHTDFVYDGKMLASIEI